MTGKRNASSRHLTNARKNVPSKSLEMALNRLLISRFVVTSFIQRNNILSLVQEVVMGDIALVEPGEIVPCDGIFISGHESGSTDGSDAIKKVPYADVVESMGNASVACTDKTGTQNAMTVVAGSVGIHVKFVHFLDENSSRTNAEEMGKSTSGAGGKPNYPYDFSIDQAKLNEILSTELKELFNEAIAVNSTAFEADYPNMGKRIFVGSQTETALLQFAKELNWRNARETCDAASVVQWIPFSSERKSMGVVMEKPQGGYRAYFKGASEILANRSTKHVAVSEDGNYSPGIGTKDIDELSRENIRQTIDFYAIQRLRTIALSYRDFETWPPEGTTPDETGEVPFDDLAEHLTLISLIGIGDPLREGHLDESVNCAPFHFKPDQLAHMPDPEDLGTLTALGRTEGIDADQDASYSHDSDLGVSELLNVISTEPSGNEEVPSEGDDNVPYDGTTDDRKQVYDENVLPVLTNKTLLQLMAGTLNDNILVYSTALPLYHHSAHLPPLDPDINCSLHFSGFVALPRYCYHLAQW
jgi:hypothetical protein